MGTPHSPNKTPHKHAELIKAWADGAEIQYWSSVHCEWMNCGTKIYWDADKYRIKPKTIKYRNYLWRCEASHAFHVSTAYTDSAVNNGLFINWLGDWQEIEI